ncbi:hypothetical protein ISN45_Aa04g029760 [Arabidopsis thaliana x Arabidopsis arenosa]|uniref:Uncharacterized protein n=1 Tax=Arabidopsis thaliana x Arabidopsis arenosa TaxID=1240361 RepID=A0A8T2AA29_9BRAS|nr:hypothetical protein ISN45_Aa04g029760 [Arabidopsis thaliana x Arabidopsis arenosa]
MQVRLFHRLSLSQQIQICKSLPESEKARLFRRRLLQRIRSRNPHLHSILDPSIIGPAQILLSILSLSCTFFWIPKNVTGQTNAAHDPEDPNLLQLQTLDLLFSFFSL